MSGSQRGVEKNEILNYVVEVLKDITSEWDVGEIGAETRLGDMGLQSINLVYLISDIQQHYDLKDLLYTELVKAGVLFNDLHVREVVDMVYGLLERESVSARGD